MEDSFVRSSESMSSASLRTTVGLFHSAFSDYVIHDLSSLRTPIARGVQALTSLLGRRSRGGGVWTFKTLMRLHSLGLSPNVEDEIAGKIKQAHSSERAGIPTGLWECYKRT